MNNNIIRHNILKVLYLSFTNSSIAGLTPSEIQSKVKIDDITLISITTELEEDRYISTDNTHYYLTTKGVNAYKDKTFLNKMWYRSIHIWISLTTVIISIIAFMISLIK